ncbi:MAG: ABC transporter permease [Betaproteobacteria bacterium]|nr:ABC transporter permease [Betaproteobacteria bacterium]
MNALFALVKKDLILYLSNKRALAITLAAPILIAAFFGSILGPSQSKPSRIPIAVVDLDNSAVTQKIIAGMKADTSLEVQPMTEAEAIALVRKGKTRAAVVFPEKFGADAGRSLFRTAQKPNISIHYDPSQSITLQVVNGVLTQHVMKAVSQELFSVNSATSLLKNARNDVTQSTSLAEADRRELLSFFDSTEHIVGRFNGEPGKPGKGSADSKAPSFELPFATTATEVTSNKERKYNSYAHSFAGMSVQFILFMGIDLGVGLLLARRLGLWKRLRAAPISRRLLLGSAMVSATLIACLLMAGIYAAAIAFFGVRIEGSIVGFAGVVLSFGILTATFGLLIAALGNTPEATRGLAILATLLLVMLGGAWVPSFIFPEWLQTISLVVPTRWAIDGLAAMTWRGLGLEAALAPIGVTLGFSALFAAIALWRFKWDE